MTSLPPFVLTRTANMRHLPAAWLDGAGAWQVMCNVSLRAFDPANPAWPIEWFLSPACNRLVDPDRLPECPRCRRRLVERDAGRSAGKRSTVGWGAESRRASGHKRIAPKARQRGAQGVRRPSTGEPTDG